MTQLADEGLLDGGLKFRPMTLPDVFIEHAKPDEQAEFAGLTARAITAKALAALGHNDVAAPARA